MGKDLYVKGYGEDKGRLFRRNALVIGVALLVILAAVLGGREWQRRRQTKPSPGAGHTVRRRMPVPPRPAEVKDSKPPAPPSKKSRAQVTQLRLDMEDEALHPTKMPRNRGGKS